MKLDYLLLDVFTTERLSGNPLAVVLKADGLLDDQMQRIAAEVNLSETVFITKPKSERHAAAERLLVCVGEHPSSAELVRRARRLADSMKASWIALHIESPQSANLNETELREADTSGTEVDNEIALPAGRLRVRFAVRDRMTGRIGTVEAPIEVPGQ